MAVQFPGKATDGAGNDLLVPIQEVLRGLSVLPGKDDLGKSRLSATFGGPAPSVAVIEAGATALSKWWSVAVAGLGGTAAISTAATGFWNGQHGGARIALIGGMAAVVAATFVAVAVIVASDVRGRAAGAVAQYNARAQVACQFMALSLGANQAAPSSIDGVAPVDSALAVLLAAAGKTAEVTHRPSSTKGHLGGIRLGGGKVEVRLVAHGPGQADSGWYPPGEFDLIKFHYADPPG
ncbi:MAG: hypothetical protein M3Y91_02640 [Actinomycetota bacterium]|nr:hypothetical protein [Actinomycetota bacterium]